MLRSVSGNLANVLKRSLTPSVIVSVAVQVRKCHCGPEESDEELDCRYEQFLNRPEFDGWEICKGMNDLWGVDLVPDPELIKSALHAYRRVYDYSLESLAVRFIKACKGKCGANKSQIDPHIVQVTRPTLTELGIDSPEELGCDKPEVALKSIYEM